MQKIKIEVTVPKKEQLFTVFGEIGKKKYVFSILRLHFQRFLHFSQKCARQYRPFRSLCIFKKMLYTSSERYTIKKFIGPPCTPKRRRHKVYLVPCVFS